MRPITFRSQVIMNALTIAIVGLIVFVSTTFATSAKQAQQSAQPQQLAATDDTTTINYQGQLLDKDGKPVNETLSMTFNLYNSETSNTALWTEERTDKNAVPVTNGLFHVKLGSVEPLSSDLISETLWLGITIGSDDEMSPREQLGSVPVTIPDGSVTSEKLDLQYGKVCLEKEIILEIPAGDEAQDIPGLSLDFTLDRPSAVLIWNDGLARFNQEKTGYRQNFLLRLDGKDQTSTYTNSDNQWYNIEGQRIVALDSGVHNLKAVAYAVKEGTLTVHDKNNGFETCINYLVLGEQ